MNAISYKQLRAFAAQYGAVVGLMWIVSFAFYIIGLTRPLVGNVGLIIGLLSVVAAGFLIRKFRGEVFPLRFGQSWWMATLIFMYASLLMAVALLKSISPIQLTFEFLVYNLMFGFLLAIPTAWIGLSGKSRTTHSQNR